MSDWTYLFTTGIGKEPTVMENMIEPNNSYLCFHVEDDNPREVWWTFICRYDKAKIAILMPGYYKETGETNDTHSKN